MILSLKLTSRNSDKAATRDAVTSKKQVSVEIPEIEERPGPRSLHWPGVVPDEEPEVDQRCRADLAGQQDVVLRHVPGPRPQHQHRARLQRSSQFSRHKLVDVTPAPNVVTPGRTVAVIEVDLDTVNIRLKGRAEPLIVCW